MLEKYSDPTGQGDSSAKQTEGCWPSVEAACEGPANSTASLPPLHSCHTPVLLSLFLAQLVARETQTLNVPGVT